MKKMLTFIIIWALIEFKGLYQQSIKYGRKSGNAYEPMSQLKCQSKE